MFMLKLVSSGTESLRPKTDGTPVSGFESGPDRWGRNRSDRKVEDLSIEEQ